MALQYQRGGGGKMEPAQTFDARSIVMGNLKIQERISEQKDYVKKLQMAASRAGNQELIAFAEKSLNDLRNTQSSIAAIEIGIRRFM